MWIIRKEEERCLRKINIYYNKWRIFPGMWLYPRPEVKGYRIVETELDLFQLTDSEIEKIYNTGETNEKEEI